MDENGLVGWVVEGNASEYWIEPLITCPSTGLDPNYGSLALASGFPNDPRRVDIRSGGAIDVGSCNLGSGCMGYATAAPDFRVNWSGGGSRLRFFFEGSEDTVLLVNDPGGRWHCNDDSAGTFNPTVTITSPPNGQYDIWVANYRSGVSTSGTLFITELDLSPGPDSGPSPTCPSTGLDPNYGSLALASGFPNDPRRVDIRSGGAIDVGSCNLGSGCMGYATAAPDFRVNRSGGGSRLRFFFEGSEDTVLLVNDPGGRWHCNDDSAGTFNPTVTITSPPNGQYDIWVANYRSGVSTSGTLFITELDLSPGPDSGPSPTCPSTGLDPNYGSLALASGFPNDPRRGRHQEWRCDRCRFLQPREWVHGLCDSGTRLPRQLVRRWVEVALLLRRIRGHRSAGERSGWALALQRRLSRDIQPNRDHHVTPERAVRHLGCQLPFWGEYLGHALYHRTRPLTWS
ncbi:MAG: hypothetical protein M5R40_24210 [Anaerolineae bacterium]|nr:hypothetical protein [Anaerolineae bacterium]